MKIYSDGKITLTDIGRAAAGVRDVYVYDVDILPNTRVRSHGYNVRLGNMKSTRAFNTGAHGAGDRGAARWDDYGHFIARLFEVDPDARMAHYGGKEEFHAATNNTYRAQK